MTPIDQLKCAFHKDDAKAVRKLLEEFPDFNSRITEKIPGCDGPVITMAKSAAMVDVLVDAGADLNAKTDWWAGGFALVHSAPIEVARHAVARGAHVDIHAAARLGDLARVESLLNAQPDLVHGRGGDGQTPLHFAATVEIAKLLLDRGADINARDVDHESTPAQWMIQERQEVARYLITRGCEADIFMGAALGDIALIDRELARKPESIRMRVTDEFFPMVGGKTGGTIYQWTLGWHVSPHQVALKFKHPGVFEHLRKVSPPDVQFVNVAWLGDEASARKVLAQNPRLIQDLSPMDQRQLAHAARNNELVAVKTMLALGWPVMSRGQHAGTPLHWAAWHGNIPTVEAVLAAKPDVNAKDADFKSTPVGWAIHASENGWNSHGADYPHTLELLFKAGGEQPSTISGSPAVREFLSNYKA